MPDFDVGQLSSNWKKLQEKLKSAPKQEEQSGDGLKRKRFTAKPRRSNTHRTTRTQDSRTLHPAKRIRVSMGARPSQPTAPAHQQSSQTKDHHNPTAITDTTSPPTFNDTINGGLHSANKPGRYIALDCEMVGVGAAPVYADNLLARVSLVNFHGAQLYDSYVLPPAGERVGDYRTPYSGITPWHLREGHARPFAEVQREVAQLLQGRVLVGHAVGNDMKVLMLDHPRREIRDTGKYGRFRAESKGKAPALKNLARSELGLTIQTGEHSSIEDARAAMMLYKKEKVGFEAENRRMFGRSSKKAGVKLAEAVEANGGGEDDDDAGAEGEHDIGEGDDDSSNDGATLPAPLQTKKRKKKKKRTKRQ